VGVAIPLTPNVIALKNYSSVIRITGPAGSTATCELTLLVSFLSDNSDSDIAN